MAQAYAKTPWAQNQLPAANAAALNNIESGTYLASAPIVTSLPASPVDGQECNYLADATNGVMWHLVYRAADAKWYYTGGPGLYSEVVTLETTTQTTYAALTTAGPSVTVPLLGDYAVEIGARAYSSTTVGGHAYMSYDIGATAAVDADNVDSSVAAANTDAFSAMRLRKKTALAAGTALVAKYRGSAGTAAFEKRWMRVVPVRLG